jgi:hypothetical protein
MSSPEIHLLSSSSLDAAFCTRFIAAIFNLLEQLRVILRHLTWAWAGVSRRPENVVPTEEPQQPQQPQHGQHGPPAAPHGPSCCQRERAELLWRCRACWRVTYGQGAHIHLARGSFAPRTYGHIGWRRDLCSAARSAFMFALNPYLYFLARVLAHPGRTWTERRIL